MCSPPLELFSWAIAIYLETVENINCQVELGEFSCSGSSRPDFTSIWGYRQGPRAALAFSSHLPQTLQSFFLVQKALGGPPKNLLRSVPFLLWAPRGRHPHLPCTALGKEGRGSQARQGTRRAPAPAYTSRLKGLLRAKGGRDSSVLSP